MITGISVFFAIIAKIQICSCTLKLKDLSLYKVEEMLSSLGDDSIKILTSIYPNIFDPKEYHSNMTLIDRIFNDANFQFESKLYLPNLNLKSIPEFICSKLKNVEELSLFFNEKLSFAHQWTKYMPKTKLRKLSISNCKLDSSDLEKLSEFENLEDLDISNNDYLDIRTNKFKKVLSKLKSLSAVSCNLDSDDFKFILLHGRNLEYLDFSCNNLENHFSNWIGIQKGYPSLLSQTSLKCLKLAHCNLISRDLENVLVCRTLKEIDLSGNYFSLVDIDQIKRIFRPNQDSFFQFYENKIDFRTPQFENECLNSLESIHISHLRTQSTEFMKNLLDIRHLKKLKIDINSVEIDFSQLQNCFCKSSLKSLEILDFKAQNTSEFMSFLNQFECLESLTIFKGQMNQLNSDFTFGNLTNTLTSLKTQNNNWNSFALKAIAECKKLTFLDASNNSFADLNQEIFIQSGNSLTEVKLNSCLLNHYGLLSFLKCKGLKKLEANRNNFEQLPEVIDRDLIADAITDISLSSSRLNKNHFNLLISFPNLKKLYLNQNDFSGIDENFKLVNPSKSLKLIMMFRCKLNHHGIKILTNIPRLETLLLSDCIFNSKENFELGCSKDFLKSLSLFSCKMNGNFLNAVAECTNLESLAIVNCQISDLVTPFNYRNMKFSLRNIALSNSRMSIALFRELKNCPFLKTINIKKDLRYSTTNEMNEIKEIVNSLKEKKPMLRVCYDL